jgi:histidyl-tRNA synthetase
MKTQPARGMRECLPVDARRREYVTGVIKEAYERYGFEALETPAIENIETLSGESGEEGDQLTFKLVKRGAHESAGEADVALRYEAELCAAASDALVALGFSSFTIRLNHRQALAGVLDAAGIGAEQHGAALAVLDQLDEIGLEEVAKELQERSITAEAVWKLISFFQNLTALEHAAEITADEITMMPAALNAAVLGRLVEFVGDHEAGARGIDELRSIAHLTAANSAGARLKIDPSLARGLPDNTGAMMKINVPGLAGSLVVGGGCDQSVETSPGQDVRACGFTLSLRRIMAVMTEREMFPDSFGGADETR